MGGGVLQKFLVASMFMGMLPIAILYCFNNDLLPGSATLSPHSLTLLSGFLAVVSVNVVIVFYICVALKEPVDKHKPDASFVADAKGSVKKLTSGVSPSTDPALKKQEIVLRLNQRDRAQVLAMYCYNCRSSFVLVDLPLL
ncbi:uncharacterized protein LOC103867707 isoform X2 [Brassica rapa]|uniref:uncharacterized protein LOC106454842 isoform X2 n=1 Tax=Brassica napus TaxID=3708 RepID=UPI00142E7460|nr:uncharacterized protein LOC106454842 isoform X2 [Brassica napus]XP_033147661.1 uncharacterized protein LOC103867707 isoform X2 [Brassica rapa]XP_033147662.1 uncharacterized protein LOC103867707 isoform X2 [Brassica rapa]XP_033147663.1 uncharacterized protein LOC103867707 isoform X2 [Brassica rapa]XP_048636759.1 uncharacterized protein LOC106454842 isoform X2 [Brassica napus]